MHTSSWVSIDADQVSWREWEGEFVFYDNLSATTHELGLQGGIVLTALLAARHPMSEAELDAILFDDAADDTGYGAEARFPLAPVLAELERIGLARPAQP